MDVSRLVTISTFLVCMPIQCAVGADGHAALHGCPERCTCTNLTLTCDSIPYSIPFGIKHVVVNKTEWEFGLENFTDVSWRNVKGLSLSNNNPKKIWKIYNGTFHTLTHLQSLWLNLDNIQELEMDSLDGLKWLEELNLSGCIRLSVVFLLKCLENKKTLPKLKYLKLNELNRRQRDPVPLLDLNDTFTDAILPRKLTALEVRNVGFGEFDMQAIVPLCTYLTSMDISASDIEGSGIPSIKPCNSLRYLNINHISYKYPTHGATAYNEHRTVPVFLGMFFINVERIEMNGMLKQSSSPYRLYNCSLSMVPNETVSFMINNLSLQYNKIQYLDITMEGLVLTNLKTLDVQHNDLEYVNPEIQKVVPNLQKYYLSFNNLWMMQVYNSSMFVNIFCNLPNLDHVYMSNNNLSFLPRRLFQNNGKLIYVDLTHNFLTQISFTRFYPQTLILNDNGIHYLNDDSMKWMDDASKHNSNLGVYLDDNGFFCTCTAVDFFGWLLSSRFVHSPTKTFKCGDNRTDVNTLTPHYVNALRKSCEHVTSFIKPVIISGGAVVSVFLLALLSYRTINVARKRLRKAKAFKINIATLMEENHEDRFAAFLSFSSRDADFVMNHVYPPLLREFRNIIDVEDGDFIAVGDLHFRPGFSIHGEMLKVVAQSVALIAVISNEYCLSPYCKLEMEMAYDLGTPIMFLLKGQVDEDLMPPIVKHIFKKYTRVKLYQKNGQIVVEPSWKSVCAAAMSIRELK